MITQGMIENYLDGEMDDQEKKSFEKKLGDDAELRKELLLHADINESISDDKKELLRQKLRNIIDGCINNESNSRHKQPLTTRIFLSRSILIAASVLFIFSIGSILFILNTKKYTPNEVFEYYYQPYNPDVVTRSSKEISAVNPALSAYLNGKYDQAADQFKDILVANPDDSMALFYSGIAFIETGEYPRAIDHLRDILNREYYPYYYHAQWYLGMTYLKIEETDKAIDLFHRITEQNKYYAEQAENILTKLER